MEKQLPSECSRAGEVGAVPVGGLRLLLKAGGTVRPLERSDCLWTSLLDHVYAQHFICEQSEAVKGEDADGQ